MESSLVSVVPWRDIARSRLAGHRNHVENLPRYKVEQIQRLPRGATTPQTNSLESSAHIDGRIVLQCHLTAARAKHMFCQAFV